MHKATSIFPATAGVSRVSERDETMLEVFAVTSAALSGEGTGGGDSIDKVFYVVYGVACEVIGFSSTEHNLHTILCLFRVFFPFIYLCNLLTNGPTEKENERFNNTVLVDTCEWSREIISLFFWIFLSLEILGLKH